MPEEPKSIFEKLDEIFKDIKDIQISVAKIDAYIEYYPKVDKATHDGLDARFERIEERIKSLEHSQIWAYRLIITTSLTTLVSIILAVMNFMK